MLTRLKCVCFQSASVPMQVNAELVVASHRVGIKPKRSNSDGHKKQPLIDRWVSQKPSTFVRNSAGPGDAKTGFSFSNTELGAERLASSLPLFYIGTPLPPKLCAQLPASKPSEPNLKMTWWRRKALNTFPTSVNTLSLTVNIILKKQHIFLVKHWLNSSQFYILVNQK